MTKHIILPLIFAQIMVLQLHAMQNYDDLAIVKADKEFSEYTKKSAKHFRNFVPDEQGACFCVLSPDKSKAAAMKAFDEYGMQAKLIIVDLATDQVLHKGNLDHKAFYESFAVSSSGELIAAVYKQERNKNQAKLLVYYPYVLLMHAVSTNSIHECIIPWVAEPLKVNFDGHDKIVVNGFNYAYSVPLRQKLTFVFNEKTYQFDLIE